MKKVPFLLLFLFALGMAQDLVTEDRFGSPDAPNVMTFSGPADYAGSHPTMAFREALAEVYGEWISNYPDWRVDIILQGGNIGQEQARLLEQARVGRAPDCALVDSFQLPVFIQQGVLQPVTEFFSEEELNDLFPFVRSGITGSDGEIYAWWFNTDLRMLYRRTDLMPEAPATWDELIAAALAAQEQDATVDGLLFNGGRWEGTTFDNLAHFWSQGGDLVDDEGRPVFSEEPNREYLLNMLNFLRETVESGAAPRRVSAITAYTDFNAAAQAGIVASFIGGHWQYFQLREALSEDDFALWDVSPIPGRTPEQGATGTGGWTIAAFSDDPEKIALCMDLVRSVYMGPLNEITGQLPTRVTLFNELPTFQQPIYERFREFLQVGQARPGFPIYPELSNQFQVMIGEVLSGAKTPEQALEDTTQRVDEAYQRLQ